MTKRPRPPLRLVPTDDAAASRPASDTEHLLPPDVAEAFRWDPLAAGPEPVRLAELTSLWDSLTDDQRRWLTMTVRKMADWERAVE